VSSLKKIELKNHKNRAKKKEVHFYETFVLENTEEALCKGYLPYSVLGTTFDIQAKKLNLVSINKLEDIEQRSFQ